MTGGALVPDRQPEQQNRAAERQHPDGEVNIKTDNDVQRQPWRIEHRQGRRTGDRRPDGIEIPDQLVHANRFPEARIEHRAAEDSHRKGFIQPRARPQQDARTHPVEEGEGEQTDGQRNGDEEEARDASRRHDHVVDGHHVEGRGQIGDVDQRAE